MITAHNVARYLLSLDNREEGDLTSNMKLQKLLYYAQGVTLALRNEPLFEERIEAWEHGPVCPPVYGSYKHFRNAPIPPPEGFDPESIPPEDRAILDEVNMVYGQFSAWRLREMTHDEPPYKDCWVPGSRGVEITKDALREFFLTRVNNA
jgi:uncharacterized phage-associated protein